MQAATIVLQYVNPATTENGPGSIKDVNGILYQVWGEQINDFIGKEGQTVTINYKTGTYRGKPQYTVLGIAGTAQGMPAAPNRATAPMPVIPAVRTFRVDEAGRPMSPPQGFAYQAEKDENIAVLALVKEWMGKIPIGDIAGVTHALRTCRAAWREFKRSHAAPATQVPAPRAPLAEFNDAIPGFDEGSKDIEDTFR
jgi:hypothetical protein